MTGRAPSGALPVLSRDYGTRCGWLYPPLSEGDGCDVTLMSFDPIPLGATIFGGFPDLAAQYGDDPYTCDSCGRSDVPLWGWSDMWAGGVDLSGTECEECIREHADPSVGTWVPSPLAITA